MSASAALDAVQLKLTRRSQVVDIPVDEDSADSSNVHDVRLAGLDCRNSNNDRYTSVEDLEVQETITIAGAVECRQDDEDVPVDASTVEDEDGIHSANVVTVEVHVIANPEDLLGPGLGSTVKTSS